MLSSLRSSSTRAVATAFLLRQQQPFTTTNWRPGPRKDYDKRVLLEPESVEYRLEDERFLRGPSWADEPYLQPTEEEALELTRVRLEKEVAMGVKERVDPAVAPFNSVLAGVEDSEGRFTGVERIPDLEARWPWVERLLPKPFLSGPVRADSTLVRPVPEQAPALPYFVQRTRSRLFPLYRDYQIVGRDHRRFWRNRWDGLFNKYHTDILDNLEEIKWENKEQTIAVTRVCRVRGDVWAFEEAARRYIEENASVEEGEGEGGEDQLKTSSSPEDGHRRVLTAVHEVRGMVTFKGDHVKVLHRFLVEKGF